MFCLPGWGCHEEMMSITNSKTDMCTEDWRAGCIFGINLDSAGWKSVKIWCKEQIASSKESNIFEGGCKRHKVNEAKSVSDMPCVGLNYVFHLTGHKALYSKLSFRSVPNTHTDISSVRFNIHNLVTVWPWTHRLRVSHCNQHAPELYISFSSPSCPVIYHHKSQSHVSKPQGGYSLLIHCQRSSQVFMVFTRVKAMASVKGPERTLPGSKSSWWPGSHPTSILQHQGCGRPGLMKR